MKRASRRILLVCAVLLATCALAAGCSSFWHDLQLHRLHRFNRQPPESSGDAYLSVADPARDDVAAQSPLDDPAAN